MTFFRFFFCSPMIPLHKVLPLLCKLVRWKELHFWKNFYETLKHCLFKPDHTVAHTVSFWLPPTAQTYVSSQISPYGICGGQIGRHIFLPVIQSLPVRIIAAMFHTHWLINSFIHLSIHPSLTLYNLCTSQCGYTLKIWFVQSYNAPYFTTQYNSITHTDRPIQEWLCCGLSLPWSIVSFPGGSRPWI